MIPLKDNVPTRTLPIIAVGFIFVNILIFLWQRFALQSSASELIYKYYGFVPHEFIISLTSQWTLVPYNVMTIFTSMFLHGGFLHLAGNMLYLWIFGKNVEDALGHIRFIFFYLVSGFIAVVFQLLYDPSSNVPMIGASGAISGVLGAYLVLYPYARIKTLLIIIIFIKVDRASRYFTFNYLVFYAGPLFNKHGRCCLVCPHWRIHFRPFDGQIICQEIRPEIQVSRALHHENPQGTAYQSLHI